MFVPIRSKLKTNMFNVFTTDLFYVLWGMKIIIKSYTAVNIQAMPEFIAEQIKVDRFDRYQF